FTKYIIKVYRETTVGASTFDLIETFKEISLTDATDIKYIVTALNDELFGSKYIEVISYNHNEVPSTLFGTQVTGEVLVPVPVYDGTTRSFVYTLASASCSPQSLDLDIFPATNDEDLGTPIGGDPSYSGTLANLPDVSKIDTVEISIVSGAAPETYVNSGVPLILIGSLGGAGTIDALGNFVVTPLAPGTVDAEKVTGDYLWITPINITDDGLGFVSIQSGGGGEWVLDPNSTNSIDYDTGVISLVWKYIANPTVGPREDHLTVPEIKWTQSVDYYTEPASSSVNKDLVDGLDGSAVTRSDISLGTLLTQKKGIYALNKTDEILQVVIPDFESDYLVVQDTIDYCLTRDDRYFIFSVPEGFERDQAVMWKKNTVSRNTAEVAACYYPQIKITDPISEVAINFPQGGHIAGIYARTFNDVNTSQAPAGIEYGQVKNYVGLERKLTESDVGVLNNNNINCIVDWSHTGTVLWGARNIQTIGDMLYIQMTQTKMFVRKMLNRVLYQYVFGSNTTSFRNKVKMNCEAILTNMYKSSYFAGDTLSEAFYVICDSTNNTQATIDKGELWITVGIALKKPSEFIILKFKQILQA
ncbi:phage tail sheath family protein, partial [Candidatus Babeliales bacterium]|nr:phage tail sheath family protein [Candidatus Babeliales bacterium]